MVSKEKPNIYIFKVILKYKILKFASTLKTYSKKREIDIDIICSTASKLRLV